MQVARGVEQPSLTAEPKCAASGMSSEGEPQLGNHADEAYHAAAVEVDPAPVMMPPPQAPENDSAGRRMSVLIPPFRPTLSGVRGFIAPEADAERATESGQRAAKTFILDLMPKVTPIHTSRCI